jgi:hypothetical protein
LPPWSDIGVQLIQLQVLIVKQHICAEKICRAVAQRKKLYSSNFFKGKQNELIAFDANFNSFLAFGGLHDIPNMSRKEALRRKLLRNCACKKYGEYLARYRYSWNINDFSKKFNSPLVINIENVENEYESYFMNGLNSGVWDINHEMHLCDLYHQIKYNARLANFTQKLLPTNVPLIAVDPTLRMFALSERA